MSECRCALCVEDEVAFATRELRDRVEQAQRWARAWKALARKRCWYWTDMSELLIAEGAARERARVVAWLRVKAERNALYRKAPSWFSAAAGIEQGEHEREGGGGG